MKKEISLCVLAGAASLAAGAVCHRLCPGLGVALMPMFWPLALLATRVGVRKATATAAIVPVVSFLLTGMPALPLLIAAKFAVLTTVAALAWRGLNRLRRAR